MQFFPSIILALLSLSAIGYRTADISQRYLIFKTLRAKSWISCLVPKCEWHSIFKVQSQKKTSFNLYQSQHCACIREDAHKKSVFFCGRTTKVSPYTIG